MATGRFVGIDVSKDRLAVAVLNPARVRQFPRASGLLAKTDKLDAQVLAEFGRKMQPKRYEGKSDAEKQLSVLLVRRKQQPFRG